MFLYSQCSAYEPKTFLYKYNDTSYKLAFIKNCRKSGFELLTKKEKSNILKTDKQELERQSLSRTKRNIFEICMCNNFEYFVTLTISPKFCIRNDLEQVQLELKKLLKAYKRKNSSFGYILITEKHLDGENYHFHGMFKGVSPDDIYTNKQGFLSCSFFDKMGYNSFSKIKNYNKCCSYITKYISSECIRNSHNQVYISSRGLKKADKYEIVDATNLRFSFQNEYCKVQNFDLDNLKEIDIENILILTNSKIYKGG